MATPTRISVPKRERISTITGWLMIFTAVFFDIIEAFFDFIFIGIIVNPILITPIAWLTFWLWLKFHGVSFGDKFERWLIMLAAGLCKDLPIIGGFIPGWTFSTWVLIWRVRAEDIAYNKGLNVSMAQVKEAIVRKSVKQLRELAQNASSNERLEANNDGTSEIEKQQATSYNRYNQDLYSPNDKFA